LTRSIAQSDNVTLEDILSVETELYHFTEPFVEPTDTWVDVGGFGNVREDQNGTIRHLGVDLAGDIGDPVFATNRGVVVYADNLQNYGNSVVIDHGLGIFSLYLHLSSIQTEAGTLVAAGERIGSIGNTGAYTLAPHLHFSIKVRGASVNPRTFIDTFVGIGARHHFPHQNRQRTLTLIGAARF
jgi:murein DD-endopeptidase MepM/ murein hydrolase activator NlpD